jgi:hypothetical protein
LASTTDDGESAIRPVLRPLEAVSIPRAEVHYVVTEYGTAYLFDRSLSQRALALIEIAHPRHREGLLAAAIASELLPHGQTLRSRGAYPVEEVGEGALRDGRRVTIRPTRADDAAGLQALFFHLRPEDVHTRFFRYLKSLTDDAAQHLCNVSYEEEMAFAAVTGGPECERIVGTSSTSGSKTARTRSTSRTWWTRSGKGAVSARYCRRGPWTTRGATVCAASRRTCSRVTPRCSLSSGAQGTAWRAA